MHVCVCHQIDSWLVFCHIFCLVSDCCFWPLILLRASLSGTTSCWHWEQEGRLSVHLYSRHVTLTWWMLSFSELWFCLEFFFFLHTFRFSKQVLLIHFCIVQQCSSLLKLWQGKLNLMIFFVDYLLVNFAWGTSAGLIFWQIKLLFRDYTEVYVWFLTKKSWSGDLHISHIELWNFLEVKRLILHKMTMNENTCK